MWERTLDTSNARVRRIIAIDGHLTKIDFDVKISNVTVKKQHQTYTHTHKTGTPVSHVTPLA